MKKKIKNGLEYTGWTIVVGLGLTAGSFLAGLGWRAGKTVGTQVIGKLFGK